MSIQLHTALTTCLAHIASVQLSDGSFESVSFASESSYAPKRTTFYTSLIMSALSNVNEDLARNICRRGALFLLEERSSTGSFNYWKKRSKEKKLFPYPDDLDDTFVALAALYLQNPALITEKVLLESITLLIANESKIGGPYYTWLVPKPRKKEWKDIDLAVNSNIAYFLSLFDIENKPLLTYIEQAIVKKEFSSRYYHSPLSVMYFITKSYKGKRQDVLQKYILRKRNKGGHWGTTLDTALAVSSLIRLNTKPSEYHEALLYLCHQSNEPKPHPFFIEQIKGKKILYSGAASFTAAVIAEALSLYLHQTDTKKPQDDANNRSLLLAAEIQKVALERFSNEPHMESVVQRIIDAISAQDKHREITLTPYFFARSLIAPLCKDEVLIMLGVANTLGWAGYTIYDDIIDKDIEVTYLPIANIMVREVSHIFKTLLPHPVQYKKVEQILDGIDQANYWEQTFAHTQVTEGVLTLPKQLPTYGTHEILAQKSLGHAIGPMIICLKSGKHHADELADTTVHFFEQYIIAKQLNDDAHDWFSDLEKGHINSIGVLVLELWQKKHTRAKTLNLVKGKEVLQQLFWLDCIDTVSSLIIQHVKKAVHVLHSLPLNEHATFFKDRLGALEKSALTAIQERNRTARFIAAHKQSKLL